MEQVCYEILALDFTGTNRCQDGVALLYAIRGSSNLWKTPRVEDQKHRIVDGDTTVMVHEVKPTTEVQGSSDESVGHAFVVRLTGGYGAVEPLREPLASCLKSQAFDRLYVLRDESSERIACQLYPLLYRLENDLRGYLIRFMSTRIGSTWWDITVTKEMNEKVKKRRRNETVFSSFVDNSAYLLDFGELGELIYEQTSGFVERKDIVERIHSLKETPEAIKELKSELQTNYVKFFKEVFRDQGFREGWRRFESFRNKVAHGNLFTQRDLDEGTRLAKELSAIIAEANRRIDDVVITEKEREAIQDSAIETSFDWQKSISKDEFLGFLQSEERRFSRLSGFVGISRFLRRLTNMGYDYHHSKEVLSELERDGALEIYQVPNPDGDHSVSAVRPCHVDLSRFDRGDTSTDV